MTNDFLNPEEQAKKLNEQDERRTRYEEFCTQMLPVYELSDPPEVIPALVRNDEYFKIYERMAVQGKLAFSDGESIAVRFLKLTGLTLKDYLLMIFSVYLNYKGMSEQEGAVKLLSAATAIPAVPVQESVVFFRRSYLIAIGLMIACTPPVMRAGPSVNRNSQA